MNQKDCERCGQPNDGVTIMSKFNTQVICSRCKLAERLHPRYKEADEAEVAAVRAGFNNFPGIGLPKDLIGGGHHLLKDELDEQLVKVVETRQALAQEVSKITTDLEAQLQELHKLWYGDPEVDDSDFPDLDSLLEKQDD